MEVKKCSKCGTFITTEGALCVSCVNKISYERTLLKNYLDENSGFNSITVLSEATGISPATIESYIAENNYSEIELDTKETFNQIPY